MKEPSRKRVQQGAPNSGAYSSRAQSLEPLHLSKDSAVVAFLNDLREEFLAKGYKANGSFKPDAQRDERIDRFVRSHRVPHSLRGRSKEYSEAVTLLLKRYERICERTGKAPHDPKFTLQVYRYLVSQLRQNIEFFQFPDLQNLVTPTLMTAEPLVSLPGKFARNNIPTDRRLFYRAFTGYSQDVVEFFERGAARLAEIDSLLAKHPGWTIPQARKIQIAFYRLPQDAKALVVDHIATVDKLRKTQPFQSWFSGQRSIIEAVVSRFKPKQVPRKLRELHALTGKLIADPDLEAFSGRKSAVLYAALSHFSFTKAKEHLQKAYKLEVKLVALHRKNNLPCNLKEIRDACLKNYKQAIRMAELLSLR